MEDVEMLKRIDILRQRADIDYREAREVLEETGGDLVAALIRLEERESWSGKIQELGGELSALLRHLYIKGTRTRIRLKQEGRTLLELPAGLGVLGLGGMLMSRKLAVLGAWGTITALLNGCSLELEPGEDGATGEGVRDGTGGEQEPGV